MKDLSAFLMLATGLLILSCQSGTSTEGQGDASGLKIAYVNGDSILMNYAEFREASENMSQKQQTAEQQFQLKMQDLEKQISAYQRKAQGGTMSPREMQAEEQRLGGMQQDLQAEGDEISQTLMSEMQAINTRLQKVIKDKLREIKEAEGYDFIFNSMEGGAILIADEKHDITDRVLQELNAEKGSPSGESSKQDE